MCCAETSMRLGKVLVLFLGLLLFPMGTLATAGQETQASITGQLKDESGSVLPGVTVTATSAALQVPSVVDVTNDRGEYRLASLPIGVYTVVYTLSGFQVVRQEKLRLTAGFVAKVDVVLKLGGVEETITVSGASPVVDVRTTAVATEFTRETLELTPTGRSGLVSLIAQVPSVRAQMDVGGSTLVAAAVTYTYGQLGEPYVTVEGVATFSPKTDIQAGGYYDYSSIEEARAEIVGADASIPRKGLKISIVNKSGGNSFHGGGFYSYTSDRFQSNNVTPDLTARGFKVGTSIVRRYDASADLGGRLVRDKLWFYGSAREMSNVDIPLGGVMPDGTPAETPHTLLFGTGKLSYQMTPANRFVAFWTKVRKKETTVSTFVPWESRNIQTLLGQTRKIEWLGTVGNSLVASLQYGYWDTRSVYFDPSPDKVKTLDIATLIQGGGSGGMRPDEWRHHTKGTFSWYRPALFLGNHEFKTGFDHMNQTISRADVGRTIGNYTQVYRNGVPFQLRTTNAPVKPLNPTHIFGLYLTDSWTLSRRLTLNVGARYSHDNGFVPAQCRESVQIAPGAFAPAECYSPIQLAIWNSVAPRVHAAYDLGGQGKTVIKGGWGRFNHMRGSDEVQLANRAALTTTTWTWNDLNGDRIFNPGEVNFDPRGPGFVSISGVADMVANPNEKQPKTDEFMLALERELMPNFAVRAAGIYHRNFDRVRLQNNLRPYDVYTIPVTNRDPGPDGRVGTADDPGTFVTYYDYPTALRGRQFQEGMYVNDPGATETYKSFEVGATKRLSTGWQLMASYSVTKKNNPFIRNTGGGNDYPLTTLDPNAEINTADRTWDSQAQLSGAYIFPHQVTVSANFQNRTGPAWGRTVLVTGGQSITSLVVRVEPIGTRRLPSANLLDLRLEKMFPLLDNHKAAVRLNLFNALNAGTPLSVVDQSGPSFGLPGNVYYATMLSPRILSFSASYSF